MKCLKCGGEMEEGALSGGRFLVFISSKFKGIQFLNKEKVRQAKTYRCKNCGYLENYAK